MIQELRRERPWPPQVLFGLIAKTALGKKRSSANDPPNAPQNSLFVSPMNRGSIKRKETHDSFLLAATVHWGNT